MSKRLKITIVLMSLLLFACGGKFVSTLKPYKGKIVNTEVKGDDLLLGFKRSNSTTIPGVRDLNISGSGNKLVFDIDSAFPKVLKDELSAIGVFSSVIKKDNKGGYDKITATAKEVIDTYRKEYNSSHFKIRLTFKEPEPEPEAISDKSDTVKFDIEEISPKIFKDIAKAKAKSKKEYDVEIAAENAIKDEFQPFFTFKKGTYKLKDKVVLTYSENVELELISKLYKTNKIINDKDLVKTLLLFNQSGYRHYGGETAERKFNKNLAVSFTNVSEDKGSVSFSIIDIFSDKPVKAKPMPKSSLPAFILFDGSADGEKIQEKLAKCSSGNIRRVGGNDEYKLKIQGKDFIKSSSSESGLYVYPCGEMFYFFKAVSGSGKNGKPAEYAYIKEQLKNKPKVVKAKLGDFIKSDNPGINNVLKITLGRIKQGSEKDVKARIEKLMEKKGIASSFYYLETVMSDKQGDDKPTYNLVVTAKKVYIGNTLADHKQNKKINELIKDAVIKESKVKDKAKLSSKMFDYLKFVSNKNKMHELFEENMLELKGKPLVTENSIKISYSKKSFRVYLKKKFAIKSSYNSMFKKDVLIYNDKDFGYNKYAKSFMVEGPIKINKKSKPKITGYKLSKNRNGNYEAVPQFSVNKLNLAFIKNKLDVKGYALTNTPQVSYVEMKDAKFIKPLGVKGDFELKKGSSKNYYIEFKTDLKTDAEELIEKLKFSTTDFYKINKIADIKEVTDGVYSAKVELFDTFKRDIIVYFPLDYSSAYRGMLEDDKTYAILRINESFSDFFKKLKNSATFTGQKITRLSNQILRTTRDLGDINTKIKVKRDEMQGDQYAWSGDTVEKDAEILGNAQKKVDVIIINSYRDLRGLKRAIGDLKNAKSVNVYVVNIYKHGKGLVSDMENVKIQNVYVKNIPDDLFGKQITDWFRSR